MIAQDVTIKQAIGMRVCWTSSDCLGPTTGASQKERRLRCTESYEYEGHQSDGLMALKTCVRADQLLGLALAHFIRAS